MVHDSVVMQGVRKARWSDDCIYNRLIRKQPSQLLVEPQWNSSRLILVPSILTVVLGESLLLSYTYFIEKGIEND